MLSLKTIQFDWMLFISLQRLSFFIFWTHLLSAILEIFLVILFWIYYFWHSVLSIPTFLTFCLSKFCFSTKLELLCGSPQNRWKSTLKKSNFYGPNAMQSMYCKYMQNFSQKQFNGKLFLLNNYLSMKTFEVIWEMNANYSSFQLCKFISKKFWVKNFFTIFPVT